MRTTTADYYGLTQSTRSQARSQGGVRPRSITSQKRILELVNTHNSSLFVDAHPKIHIKDESGWASKDEERVEVGTQLAVLRKKHDQSKNVLNKRDENLQSLRNELSQLSAVEQTAQSAHTSMMERLKQLEEEIRETREQRARAKDERLIYEHVLERMKKTKVHLELQSHRFDNNLRTKKQVVTEQLQRMRKSQENSSLARHAVEVARELFTRTEKQQEDQASDLERNVRIRREMASRREERQIHQAELAEQAANNQQDAEETRLRHGYLLHKFWWNALQRKLEKDKAQSVEIEEAFQRIKIATGVGDVHEIVEKFLTKEHTYSRLVQAVTETEQRVERLKQQIEDKQRDIRQFQVSEEKLSELTDVKKLDDEIGKELKEVQNAQSKLQKHVVVYDHIAEWVRKVYGQLYRIKAKSEPPASPEPRPGQNYLSTMFHKLTSLVDELLEPLKAQREEVIRTVDSQAAKKLDDLLQQSPESIRKVVRIRPNFTEEEELDFESGHRRVLESSPDDKWEAEAVEDLLEMRRKMKQISTQRQESARKKKLKEKKQETKKEK